MLGISRSFSDTFEIAYRHVLMGSGLIVGVVQDAEGVGLIFIIECGLPSTHCRETHFAIFWNLKHSAWSILIIDFW